MEFKALQELIISIIENPERRFGTATLVLDPKVPSPILTHIMLWGPDSWFAKRELIGNALNMKWWPRGYDVRKRYQGIHAAFTSDGLVKNFEFYTLGQSGRSYIFKWTQGLESSQDAIGKMVFWTNEPGESTQERAELDLLQLDAVCDTVVGMIPPGVFRERED